MEITSINYWGKRRNMDTEQRECRRQTVKIAPGEKQRVQELSRSSAGSVHERVEDTGGEAHQEPEMMPKPIVKMAASSEPDGGRRGAGIELKANRL